MCYTTQTSMDLQHSWIIVCRVSSAIPRHADLETLLLGSGITSGKVKGAQPRRGNTVIERIVSSELSSRLYMVCRLFFILSSTQLKWAVRAPATFITTTAGTGLQHKSQLLQVQACNIHHNYCRYRPATYITTTAGTGLQHTSQLLQVWTYDYIRLVGRLTIWYWVYGYSVAEWTSLATGVEGPGSRHLASGILKKTLDSRREWVPDSLPSWGRWRGEEEQCYVSKTIAESDQIRMGLTTASNGRNWRAPLGSADLYGRGPFWTPGISPMCQSFDVMLNRDACTVAMFWWIRCMFTAIKFTTGR